MLYQEAMDYLQNLTKFGMNFGLGRITELLRRLNNPHQRIRVIHVGGTNGKGSTTAMMAQVLQSSGYRVGTFTSPHLHSFTERYRINNEEITPERVAQLIGVLRPHLESMVAEGFEHPTEFEVSTALGFCYFEEEKVDYLVLEVGLGGAIDSTNVVTPILSVITNIAMDHMDYLGHTIAEIAGVKAGIIKPGVPLVTAADKPEALNIIETVCKEKGSRLIKVGHDVHCTRGNHSLQGQSFDYDGMDWKMKDLWISFLGSHQVSNAATAVAALEVLQQQGVNIGEDALRKGLAATIWPARLELIGNNPPVLVDAAHNYDGARCLRQALDEYFPEKRIIMVLGMLGDKERSKVVAELAPRAGHVIITKPNSPRAGAWMQMADEARRYLSKVETIEDIVQAITSAINLAGAGDLVIVTGSFYMVAEAREAVLKHNGLI